MSELCSACDRHHQRQMCCCKGEANQVMCSSGLTMYCCPHSLCTSRLFNGLQWERNTAAIYSSIERTKLPHLPQPQVPQAQQPQQQLGPLPPRQPVQPEQLRFEDEWRAWALAQMRQQHLCTGLTDWQYEPLWGAGLQGTMTSTQLQGEGVLQRFPFLHAELEKVAGLLSVLCNSVRFCRTPTCTPC
jgi:hypothetical protein